MIAISDASPLILYSSINRLDILHDVFGVLTVPAAVWTEVVDHGMGRVGANEIAEASWIRRLSPQGIEAVASFRQRLGAGESEALVLASELSEEVVLLLDDRQARLTARRMGYRVVGSGGVLGLAKLEDTSNAWPRCLTN